MAPWASLPVHDCLMVESFGDLGNMGAAGHKMSHAQHLQHKAV